MYGSLRALDDEQLQLIHSGAMRLLAKTGVAFGDAAAVDLFKAKGFAVEGHAVRMTETQVQQALETAPPHFIISGRHPERAVGVGGDDFALVPGYGASFVIDADGRRRASTLEDYVIFCKLVHTSPVIKMNGYLMVEPTDIPAATAHLDMVAANILYCDKPFMGSPTSRRAAVESLELARFALGDLEQKTVMAALITPLPPLRYSPEMAGAIMEYAAANQACIFGDLVMAGASGPITIPGLLTQQTAELLAGVVLSQLVRPGAPVAIGSASSIMDLRTGVLSMGAPEYELIAAATAQIARFYNLPARSGCAATDAFLPDAQAGVESALGMFTALLSGSNFILHAAGILGGFDAMSFEKFLIDEEICANLVSLIRRMEVTEDTIALEVIEQVGIGGDYLTHPQTLQLCRQAFFASKLMWRRNYQDWVAAGSLPLHLRAHQVFQERLSSYQQPDIDPGVAADIRALVEQRQRR